MDLVQSLRRTKISSSEPTAKIQGIERGTHLNVVVEIDVYIAGARPWLLLTISSPCALVVSLLPCADALCPAVQRFRRVAAYINLPVSMQADVDEIRGKFLCVGPLPGSISKYECQVILPQKVEELRHEKAGMTHLTTMPELVIFRRCYEGPSLELLIVTGSEL